MKILLFPTRFYPAISGGDYYLQALGEHFQKNREIRVDQQSKKRNKVLFCTTDAINFAALHGAGKIVNLKHKNYSSYRGMDIMRLHSIVPGDIIYEENVGKFRKMIREFLCIREETVDFFINKGPIFSELPILISSGDKGTNFDKPDIIHTTYLPYANIIYALLMARHYRCPCVITPFLHEENRRYHDSAIQDVLKQFDLIFACTPYEKKLYMEMGIEETKISVLPMGIELSYYTSDHSAFIQKIVHNNNPTILFTGYKNYEKGALTLIKAIPLVTNYFGQVNFIFIGPASTAYNYELAHLKPELKGSLVINISPDNLTGIYDKKKIGAFQYADIFCMPSRSDAYGIVYLEAWLSKTPVIAADIPAMRAVVIDGKDGLLVPFDDPESCAQAIIQLLRDPELRIRMGEAGYEKVIRQNQWGFIAKKTYEYYQNLITMR